MTYRIIAFQDYDEIVPGGGICTLQDKNNAREIVIAMRKTHPEFKYLILDLPAGER